MKKAYTLIEVIVLLSIVILLSLIVTPLFFSYQKTTKLKSEARILATNLRYGQQLAITQQNVYKVQLFPPNGHYQIINTVTNTVTKDVTMATGITVSDSGFTGDAIQFSPTGAAIQTGTITLTNSLNQISTIQIKPSGYVEVSQ